MSTAVRQITWNKTGDMPCRPESARTARHLVEDRLREMGLLQVADDAKLIVSELVGNAARYTGCTKVRVRVDLAPPRTVRVSVEDSSRELPVLMDAGDDEECHRGLALVAALAKRWGVQPTGTGKVVWADLEVPAASRSQAPPGARPASAAPDEGPPATTGRS